jgi:uncharacterized protein YkwD
LLLAAGMALAGAAAASPELLDALNAVRASGCGGRAGVTPALRENAQLSEAAKRSTGPAFNDALVAAGYRANRSMLIQVSGGAGTASLVELLKREYCAPLLDSAYSDVGIHRQLRETRIILAAPFLPPPAQAADAVALRVLQLVNQTRERPRTCGATRFPAARPLLLNDLLSRASLAHAADMAQYNYFAHEGRDGSSPADRLTRTGLRLESRGREHRGRPDHPGERGRGLDQ